MIGNFIMKELVGFLSETRKPFEIFGKSEDIRDLLRLIE